MFVQHTLPDVVVVGASVHWHVRLWRDRFAESSIGCFDGMVVAFPGPGVQLHASLLPGRERTLKRGIECVRKLRGGGSLHLAFGNFRVPNVMEFRGVGVIASMRIPCEVFDWNAISAA